MIFSNLLSNGVFKIIARLYPDIPRYKDRAMQADKDFFFLRILDVTSSDLICGRGVITVSSCLQYVCIDTINTNYTLLHKIGEELVHNIRTIELIDNTVLIDTLPVHCYDKRFEAEPDKVSYYFKVKIHVAYLTEEAISVMSNLKLNTEIKNVQNNE